jgi:hypothetical protein
MLLSNPLEYKHDCGVVPLRCLVLGGLAVVEAIKHGLYQNLLEAARRSGLDEHQGRVFGERSYGGVQSLLYATAWRSRPAARHLRTSEANSIADGRSHTRMNRFSEKALFNKHAV